MLRPTWLLLGSLTLVFIGLLSATGFTEAGQTVVVVLDDSGSMERNMQPGQRRIAAAKQALSSVLSGLSHDTKIGILALNTRVNDSHWIVPIGSPDAGRWAIALNRLRAKGGTPLGQFMRNAADELLKLREQEPYETYRLLVVTDGEATDAPLLNSILPDLLSRGLRLDVIGVAMQEEHSLARSAHSYRQAGDQAALAGALQEVFAETSADDQTNQADFDMLAGLSEEAAREIVKGLSAPRNDPLAIASDNAPAPEDGSAGGNNSSTPPANPGGSARSTIGVSVGILFSTVCCLGSIGLISLIVLAIVLNAIKNNTRS